MVLQEVARIREHLCGAEAFASTRALVDLDPAQRLTRALLLDELARYRKDGVFPKNHDSAAPRPTFIDEHGTRCAMAHLMEIGGAADLVAEVAHENNHAYVEELARDARVIAWLRGAGLTVEEAARIQPSYCQTAASCLCERLEGAGVWEGTVVASADASPGLHARIDEVHAGTPPPGDAGDVVRLYAPLLPDGTRVLAGGQSVFGTIEAGEVLANCLTSDGLNPLPPITKTRAIEMILAPIPECMSTLAAEDPAWTNGCDAKQPPHDAAADASADGSTDARANADVPAEPMPLATTNADDGGCSVSLASSSPESLSVLFAVLSALAVRRSVRRRSAGR